MLQAHLETLSAAQNDAQSTVKCSFCLGSHKCVVFLQNNSSLRVSQDSPGDTAVLELVDTNLASEGTVGLIKDVLRGNFETFAEMLAGE